MRCYLCHNKIEDERFYRITWMRIKGTFVKLHWKCYGHILRRRFSRPRVFAWRKQ